MKLEELPDVDKEMRPFLDKINEVPFICTTQSCWGHPNDGYLSLMVIEDYGSWMELMLLELADMGFDTVAKHECVGENEIRVRYIVYFNDDNRIQLLDHLIKRIGEAEANHGSLKPFLKEVGWKIPVTRETYYDYKQRDTAERAVTLVVNEKWKLRYPYTLPDKKVISWWEEPVPTPFERYFCGMVFMAK